MAGYCRYSMSNNAVEAYKDGERPLTKWNKKEIIKEVMALNNSIDLSMLSVKQMKENILCLSSWHHTSKMYNSTDFYKVKDDIKDWTQNDINKIIYASDKEKRITELKKENLIISKELKENGFVFVDDIKVEYVDDFNMSQFTIKFNEKTLLWSPKFDDIHNIMKGEHHAYY